MEQSPPTPQAISGITDPENVRVLLFINNQWVHCPLNALLEHIQSQIDALDARVTVLEP
jgi:hypothetical protein